MLLYNCAIKRKKIKKNIKWAETLARAVFHHSLTFPVRPSPIQRLESIRKCINMPANPRPDSHPLPLSPSHLRMATGRVRFGWSIWAPKTETRTWNPNPTRTPIRVQIQTQNRNPRIPETERIIRNPIFFQTSNASQQHHFIIPRSFIT